MQCLPSMDDAYAGIDVAFAKRKYLPVVVCVHRANVLEPLPLRTARAKPPIGAGNAATLNGRAVEEFATRTVEYLQAIESEYGVRIRRVAVDAPSDPRPNTVARRRAEAELDRRRISCITTPTWPEFRSIRERGLAHLAQGQPESNLPGANQLWMLVGFSLFQALRPHWECLEVFPQAIVSLLGVSNVHKSRADGFRAQLQRVARYTGWPREGTTDKQLLETGQLGSIAFGSSHDRLDAYMAAWVASLEESRREPLGEPPSDVIWVPRTEPAP